jgi:ferredoxin
MDGIIAMEGNGPRSGNPRQMGALLLSRDPIAVDAVASRMVGLNPEFVPTAPAGEKAGLGNYRDELIEIIGGNLGDFIVNDFDVVKQPVAKVTAGFARVFVRNRISPRPTIDLTKCDACGTCVKMCPVGKTALDWVMKEAGKKPKHNSGNCIRCYCCQEVCPKGAISVRTPLLGKVAFRNAHTGR